MAFCYRKDLLHAVCIGLFTMPFMTVAQDRGYLIEARFQGRVSKGSQRELEKSFTLFVSALALEPVSANQRLISIVYTGKSIAVEYESVITRTADGTGSVHRDETPERIELFTKAKVTGAVQIGNAMPLSFAQDDLPPEWLPV